MKKFLSVGIFVIIFFQCKQPHVESQKYLQGKWKADLKLEEVNYPEIIIQGKSLVLTSKGDTLYRYTYHIEKNIIILKTVFDKNCLFKTKYCIVNNKLIFDSLPYKKHTCEFLKEKHNSHLIYK